MDYNAIVDGDFAVVEDELQPVLKSLLEDKINIVAISSGRDIVADTHAMAYIGLQLLTK
jgi:hypothetical protein